MRGPDGRPAAALAGAPVDGGAGGAVVEGTRSGGGGGGTVGAGGGVPAVDSLGAGAPLPPGITTAVPHCRHFIVLPACSAATAKT